MFRYKTRIWLIIILTITALIFSLPEEYTFKFNYQGISLKQTISAPHININIGPLRIKKEIKTHLGLDLKGGSHLVFNAELDDIDEKDRKKAVNAARDTIEKRVNFFGVSEASIQTAKINNSYRIIVELPGVENAEEAIKLIGKTAQLNFREREEATESAKIATFSAKQYGLFTKETKLTGAHLKRAQVQFDRKTGKPAVGLEFNKEGAQLFEEITERNINKPLAIFLDEQIVSAPQVKQAISGGQALISGDFNTEEAKRLTTQLNAGALPVSVELVRQRNVGPSLGQEAVDKSIRAGSIGLFLVAFFMIGFYGKLGLIAAIALIIYGLISFAVFRFIPVTLTLSGIAGFILSIGMAVDANILIFERMREEKRKGRPHRQAMQLGFGRAWNSIKDANVATLLTTFVLFNPLDWSFLPRFGMIRGFALTLAIGVLVGLFTGVVVTRTLMETFLRDW